MEEEILLEIQVESVRVSMIQLAEEIGSLLDLRVIEVSQQLDDLLVRLQRMRTI